MIKTKPEMRTEVLEHVRDGKGSVIFTHMLEQDEFDGQARMIAQILLKPNCSIGYHQHCGEEEVITVLKGEAAYVENGKQLILKEGDTCITSNGESHGIANETKNDLLLYAVIFTHLSKK